MAESNTRPAREKQGALCVAIDLPTKQCKNPIKENILNDQSWKKTHLIDPNRKPLTECPHCDWKAYSVIEAWGKASHMWECHGVPGEFTMNGRTTQYGPDSADPAPEDTELSEHLILLTFQILFNASLLARSQQSSFLVLAH